MAITAGGQDRGGSTIFRAIREHNAGHSAILHQDIRHFGFQQQGDVPLLHLLHNQRANQFHHSLAAAGHTVLTGHIEGIVGRGHLGLTVAEVGAQLIQPVHGSSRALGVLLGQLSNVGAAAHAHDIRLEVLGGVFHAGLDLHLGAGRGGRAACKADGAAHVVVLVNEVHLGAIGGRFQGGVHAGEASADDDHIGILEGGLGRLLGLLLHFHGLQGHARLRKRIRGGRQHSGAGYRSAGHGIHFHAVAGNHGLGQFLQGLGTNALGLVGTLRLHSGQLTIFDGQRDRHVTAKALGRSGIVFRHRHRTEAQGEHQRHDNAKALSHIHFPPSGRLSAGPLSAYHYKR